MSRLMKIAFLVNTMLCLLFVYSNFSLWQMLNGRIIQSYWNPFGISLVFHYHFPDGTYTTVQGIYSYPNMAFMLFWVSTIVNMYILVKVMRSKKVT